MSLRHALLSLFALVALTTGTMPPAAGQQRAQPYALVADASAVSVTVPFLGLGQKSARFPDVSGTLLFEPDTMALTSLAIRVDARTLTAASERDRRELRGPAFFNVDAHPEIRFEGNGWTMTSPTRGSITGRMTARGVTVPVTLAVTLERPLAEMIAREGQGVRLSAQGRVSRAAFGMTAYPLIVGQTVTVRVNAQFVPRR